MKLGFIIESMLRNGKRVYSPEVEHFISWFADKHYDTYFINIHDNPVQGDAVKAIHAATEQEDVIPASDFDLIYFGNTGQKIEQVPGHKNSLAGNFPKISSFSFFYIECLNQLILLINSYSSF